MACLALLQPLSSQFCDEWICSAINGVSTALCINLLPHRQHKWFRAYTVSSNYKIGFKLAPALKDDTAFSGRRILERLNRTLAIRDLNTNLVCLSQQQLVEFGPVMSIYSLRDIRSLVRF